MENTKIYTKEVLANFWFDQIRAGVFVAGFQPRGRVFVHAKVGRRRRSARRRALEPARAPGPLPVRRTLDGLRFVVLGQQLVLDADRLNVDLKQALDFFLDFWGVVVLQRKKKKSTIIGPHSWDAEIPNEVQFNTVASNF